MNGSVGIAREKTLKYFVQGLIWLDMRTSVLEIDCLRHKCSQDITALV